MQIDSPSQWNPHSTPRAVMRAHRLQTLLGQTIAFMRGLAFIVATNHDEPRRALLGPVTAPVLDQNPPLRF